MSKQVIYLHIMPKAVVEVSPSLYRSLHGSATEVMDVCESSEVIVIAIKSRSTSLKGRREAVMHAAMVAVQASGHSTRALRAVGRFAPRKTAVTASSDPSKYDRMLL